MQQRAQLQPQGGEPVLKIRLRLTASAIPAEAKVTITDVMLQPGTTVTGWAAHVSELPWTAGITGGS